MDAEGLLDTAWVKIGRILANKICDKTVAYVGGLVGITLEVDMSTINRPSSVQAKIGSRYIDQLLAMAESVIGGRFYKFTYEVEEVLVRNPVEAYANVVVSREANSPQVMEVDPTLKIPSDYMVQSPTPECSDEFILTPPLALEAVLRFSKHTVQGMKENIEAKATNLANK
ncbi:hypothetical protein D1007_22932 [Hordeum vulgare]|nr:hypothetical protein D1007_22932 [Hordeum vulgare]